MPLDPREFPLGMVLPGLVDERAQAFRQAVHELTEMWAQRNNEAAVPPPAPPDWSVLRPLPQIRDEVAPQWMRTETEIRLRPSLPPRDRGFRLEDPPATERPPPPPPLPCSGEGGVGRCFDRVVWGQVRGAYQGVQGLFGQWYHWDCVPQQSQEGRRMSLEEGVECTRCHQELPPDDAIEVEIVRWGSTNRYEWRCRDCSFYCDDCGQHRPFDGVGTRMYEYGGDPLCESCYEEDYSDCNSCGEIVHRDNAAFDDDYYYCNSCGPPEDEHEEDRDGIFEYSYRPEQLIYRSGFHQPDNTRRNYEANTRPKVGVPYFGIELEVEVPRRTAHISLRDAVDIGTADGVWYPKHDGSLHNGVEFVSHPGDLWFWRQADLKWMTKLARNGCRSYNTGTCGIHIHVSRSAMTTFEWFKLFTFLKASPDLIRRTSRRKPELLAQWAGPFPERELRAREVRDLVRYGFGKYRAVNFDGRKTVEFRLFRGTLSVDSFRRNLEWVNAVCEFARRNGLSAMTEAGFREWLASKSSVPYIGTNATDSLGHWLFNLPRLKGEKYVSDSRSTKWSLSNGPEVHEECVVNEL